MADKENKKGTKVQMSEDDAANLLQRYSPETVLTLLQEIANHSNSKKIDWTALVSNTLTGITNAREYQMLWRHLAYNHPLSENVDNEAEPLDDDSDIEIDLEASPAVSSEVATDAAAYVKVHIASGSLIHSSNCVEGSLTINIPDGHEGKDITIPVFVPDELSPSVAPAEGLDANGTSSDSNLGRKKQGFPAGGPKLNNVTAQSTATSENGLLTPARLPSKPLPDSTIKAAALAAGARIASPEEAASYLKAMQVKTGRHIRSGGVGSLTKSSVSGCTSASPIHSGPHQNVPRVSTGMVPPPLPTTYSTGTPIASRSDFAKPISPTGTVAQSYKDTSSTSDLDLALKQDVKGSEETKVLNSGKETMDSEGGEDRSV